MSGINFDITCTYIPCYSYRACFYIPYFVTNKMLQLKYNTTDHTAHSILGANSYIFRHKGAIFKEFTNNKG